MSGLAYASSDVRPCHHKGVCSVCRFENLLDRAKTLVVRQWNGPFSLWNQESEMDDSAKDATKRRASFIWHGASREAATG